jgi:type I site-specific restriction endonuclease
MLVFTKCFLTVWVLANGLEIHFVDVGIVHKREVFGFFTREDLENLLYIRQNAEAEPLS